jgi:transcriptional regulator of acetoin/glycerol metabolism
MRTHALLPAIAVRQARDQLLETGHCPSEAIDPHIVRSWTRSLAAGLTPGDRTRSAERLPDAALAQAQERNEALLRHSLPAMEYLFEQVRRSHSMVILADRDGTLMHTLGDLDFLGRAERVALAAGACWHESQRGTNAIGTALAEGTDIVVHGAEHYLDKNDFLTCSAAPIFSAQGELLGILDISGDQRGRHPHTLGLVSTAARMVENSLVLATYPQRTVLQLHPRPEGLGGIAQGLLALSQDGWLVGANRQALTLLGLQASDLRSVACERLWGLTLDQLLNQAQRAGGRPLRLEDASGQVLYARLRASQVLPGLRTGPIASRASRTAPRHAAGPDALARLDTGDTAWRAAADKARRVVGKGIPLLLLGESGVGKEWFAQAVHQASPRAGGPFVAINCAALPEALIESELFGYVPGAYTGARKQGSPGRLREAQGGTLFLDEIGDMPPALQTRLLRVLQEHEVTPLGGGRPVAVDFQLVCATHQDLAGRIAQGTFREDLYYRINGLAVRLPALRERSDFAALAERMLADLSSELGEEQPLRITPDLLPALATHRWPGNLRQLHNLLRTAAALREPHENQIGWQHLPDDVLAALRAERVVTTTVAESAPEVPAASLQALSQQMIAQALAQHQGNVSATARQLGISRQTLYRRMQHSSRR